MIVHSDSADHGERSHQAAIPQYVCLPEPGSLRTGENGEAFHQQRVANAVVIIDGDGDDGARLKAPGGAADAHPPLLAQAIKGAIEAADLPAAKGQLGKPGDGGDDD